MKKRILSGFIALACALCGAFTAFADSTVNGISVTKSDVKPGDEFSVNITVPATSGRADSGEIWVDFNKSAFEVTNWKPSSSGYNSDNTQGFFTLAYMQSNVDLTNGVTYTASMKVKSGAAEGSYAFTIRKGYFSYVNPADGKTSINLWTPSVKTVYVSVTTNPVSGKISVKGVGGTAVATLKTADGYTIETKNVPLSYNNTTKAYEGTYSFGSTSEGYKIEILLDKCPTRTITVGTSATEDAPLRMYGDVDGNGVIEAIDATQIMRYTVGLPSWIKGTDGKTDEYIKSVAILKEGGEPTEKDATIILRYVTGYTSALNGI